MICNQCQTNLPDEAIACWKCGEKVGDASATQRREPVDPILVILTLIASIAFFVCLGWAIPFTIWGNIITLSKDHPGLAGVLDAASGVAFYGSAIGLFLGAWWGSYKIVFKLMKTS